MEKDVLIRIGGAAGQGMNTLASLLAKALQKRGHYLFTMKDYMSRIRGGHNFMDIRVSGTPLTGSKDTVDILLALDENSYDVHKEKLHSNSVALGDEKYFQSQSMHTLPMQKKAEELGDKRVGGVIALGGIMKVLGLELSYLEEALAGFFSGDTLQRNVQACRWGYEQERESFSPPPTADLKDCLLISGNEAVGLGALAGGVQFYAAYPMTPSTGIVNFLAKRREKYDLIVEQAEDEIAAINMALGASFGGARAMTGTSGGGFSLMVEGLGLAGITETPLVVAEVQRPGPATGLPTRTEQSDLNFVVFASQGEFPRLVLAPRNQEEAFYQTIRALNLADAYQLPVIVLSDQYLADSQCIIPPFAAEKVEVNRGSLYLRHTGEAMTYKRYKCTDNGVSPFLLPGAKDQVVLADSDEHNERGNIIEDGETRKAMVEKRMKKLETLVAEDLEQPLYKGSQEGTLDLLLMTWGSPFGPVEEAREILEEQGYSVGHLSFQDIWPVPRGGWEHYVKDTKSVLVENSYQGQLSMLLQSQGAPAPTYFLGKYDGRPFTGEEIVRRLEQEVGIHG